MISDFQEDDNQDKQAQRSCIHIAAKHGENEILQYLLGEMFKQQLPVDVQDTNGNSAAHLAAKYNHLNCLQTLVEFNCDVTLLNKSGHTPCFVAEFFGNEECVHYLMIVETCISLSVKVVKVSRKLRETKVNNEILKAQMEEAIGINNDFINQRENCMNISLDMMQRQINEFESKLINEIERLGNENKNLMKKINFQVEHETNLQEKENEKIKILFENQLKNCKQEVNNTQKICHNVFKMDEKKLNSVKSRFNEIKLTIETANEINLNSRCSDSNCFDIIENKEHLEVLR